MSLVYLGLLCATVGVVDDGGELWTLNDVALILQVMSIGNWKSKAKNGASTRRRKKGASSS